MNKKEDLRLKLFQTYSTNLKMVTKKMDWRLGFENEQGIIEEPTDPYICPICYKLFVKESLEQNNLNPLTLEHVPPEKLGGKPITLTCKNCNNKLGGDKLDSKLIWHQEIEPFLKGKPNSHIKAYYEINKRTKAKGRLTYIDKNKFGISFNPKTNPNLKEELDYLIKNWDKTTIKFSFQGPNQKKVLLALLRVAFLKMFSTFGYGYFFNTSSRIISNQLFEQDKDLIPDFGIPNFDNLPPNFNGIHIITSPKEVRSFLVIFDVSIAGDKKTYSVLIPGPDKDCLSLYSKFKEKKKYQLELTPIPLVDYLTDERNIFAYTEMWNEFKK
jgi:hypothetical protein